MQGATKPAVGLDFGTSTTLIASGNGVIPIGVTSAWMPSVVGYGDDGSVVVGELALDAPVEQVVRSIKRMVTERRDFVRVDTPTGVRDVRADDLMVELLREAARRGLSDKTGSVVRLGCPAMWDGRQRRRLVALAQRAGLPVTLANLVDEPIAAGIAWLAGRPAADDRPLRVVVFDMGGGTLDIAVLDVRGAGGHDVTVLAALGIAEAGDTLDEAIAENLDLVLDIESLPRPDVARELLLAAARKAKMALTTSVEHPVVLPANLFRTNEIWYTRDQLDEVFAAQMDRAEQFLVAALMAARLTEHVAESAYDIARTPIDTLVEGVDVVVLSGGMSQIPFVEQRMRAFFAATTTVERATRSPEQAVVVGLARAGAHGRINMYRPAFDIVVEWAGEARAVYEAYTPLVEPRQIAQGRDDLRFIRTGLDLTLPHDGQGRLRIVSYSDEPVGAMLGGRPLDGFPVALSEQKFEFSIYPNGRIRMTDGGGTYDGHVQGWNSG